MPAAVPAEVAAVALVAARQRWAARAAAVGLATGVGLAAAGTEQWAAPAVLTASSGPRSAAASAWQARAVAVAAAVAVAPPGVGVEATATTLVARARDTEPGAAAVPAASPVAAGGAYRGAAQLWVAAVAGRQVAAVAVRQAEIPAGLRGLDRRA
jgi:hypothetical protein